MRITLESTRDVFPFTRGDQTVMVRAWHGHTDDGTPVHAYIATVSPQTHDKDRLKQFDDELGEIQAETVVRAIDLRFIL